MTLTLAIVLVVMAWLFAIVLIVGMVHAATRDDDDDDYWED